MNIQDQQRDFISTMTIINFKVEYDGGLGDKNQ
jgi:hypothetical protein